MSVAPPEPDPEPRPKPLTRVERNRLANRERHLGWCAITPSWNCVSKAGPFGPWLTTFTCSA